MKIESIQPEGWQAPKGYSNGMLVTGEARLLFVAGQVAWDADCRIVTRPDDDPAEAFVAQFRQCLANVLAVVTGAGGAAEHVVELTFFVIDKDLYASVLREVGAAYRELMGKHFPAMALVQVAALLEEGAMLEIQARAALPPA